MNSDSKIRTFQYHLITKEGTKTFSVRLDDKSLDYITREVDAYPEWTALDFCQCPNCPFQLSDRPHCPVAVNLIEVVKFLQKVDLHENILMRIVTDERTIESRCNLDTYVFSLVGIVMATSGCPIMDKLRPLARFHLPFATTDETVYRSASMYLIAQYLRKHEGQEPDWSMRGLQQIYNDINQVNGSFYKRLADIRPEHFGSDAIAKLDCFAYYINLSLSGNVLKNFENIFSNYLKES